MATPTPQSTASSNSGNANGTSDPSLVMPTVLDGDGVILVMTSSRGAGAFTGNAPALPSGAFTRVGGSSAGDTTASATCTTQVWVKDNLVAATDSGASISGTVMLSGRYGDGLMTYRGGTFEQCTAVHQTTTAVNPADAGITPTAADCLRVIVSGYDPASGSSTALTPPASPGTWTEQLEAENTASTTFRPGAYFATTPLTGQAGSAQSAATISATTKPNANTYAVTIAPTGGTPATGTASLDLVASGTAAAPVTGAGALSLVATGTAQAADTGTAALALNASGAAAAAVVGSAAVDLVATGSAAGPGSTGTAALALNATATARAAASGSAAVTLVAAGSAQAPVTGAGALSLVASGTAAARGAGSAVLSLLGQGVAAARAAGSALLSLIATDTAQAGGASSPSAYAVAHLQTRRAVAGEQPRRILADVLARKKVVDEQPRKILAAVRPHSIQATGTRRA